MKNKLIISFFFAMSFSGLALAHGYIDSPNSRAFLCSSSGKNMNKNCGAVQYEPQSVEGIKGFPDRGPVDGRIASGGNLNFLALDEQTPTRWHKVDLSPGNNKFNWKLTAPHSTTSWQFFITKPNWNPSSPLTRDDFDLTPFCERYDSGAVPKSPVEIECNVPNRTGYQIILGVWTIADTGNAFYQVIDVNMK